MRKLRQSYVNNPRDELADALANAVARLIVEVMRWIAKRNLYKEEIEEEKFMEELSKLTHQALMLPKKIKSINTDGNKVIIEFEEA